MKLWSVGQAYLEIFSSLLVFLPPISYNSQADLYCSCLSNQGETYARFPNMLELYNFMMISSMISLDSFNTILFELFPVLNFFQQKLWILSISGAVHFSSSSCVTLSSFKLLNFSIDRSCSLPNHGIFGAAPSNSQILPQILLIFEFYPSYSAFLIPFFWPSSEIDIIYNPFDCIISLL